MGKRFKKVNWKSYNKELINRGSKTFWFPQNLKEYWLSNEVGPGFQKIYSEKAIEAVSIIKFFFNLPLRSTQGFTSRNFEEQFHEAALKCKILIMMNFPSGL